MATPKVGELATMHYPSDSYPFIVTAVSASGSKVTLAELERAAKEPARFAGGFPVWDCPGDPSKRTGRTEVAFRNAQGRYFIGRSTPVTFGYARYHRDYSD
jgi:hypothetical protein